MLRTLRDQFGFNEFREGQEPVVRALLEGRSALAVFPTGGGKSLCYQLPALLLDGLTLVISPLIALMKDQTDRLTARGIAAARLDSTLEPEEAAEVFRRWDEGELKLLYVAPERLANEGFRRRLKRLPIALAAIDEAHCISEWGHNFRPDYLKLARILRAAKVPRVLALTATATPKVARDIRRHFRIAADDHIQLSFHRPNLDLRISPCAGAGRKALLLSKLRGIEGSCVVYVTRQETAEEVATFLAKNGLSARAYHAGLPDDFRFDAQAAFMEDRVRIIVATIAFGMGIDKPDIRAVFHYNLPKSLENYTEEIGRGGRDGETAICEMLACADDLTVLENFIYSDTPSSRALDNLIQRVLRLGERFDVSLHDLSVACDIRRTVIATVMTYLEIDGILETTGSRYASYRAKALRSPAQILAGRKPGERKWVAALMEAATTKYGWWEFSPDTLAPALGASREKIGATLEEMRLAGDIALKVSGVRQVYRMKKDPGDPGELAARLSALFQQREKAELQRLAQVIALPSRRKCLTGALTEHFGETLAVPCGHCDRCRGVPATTVKRPAPRRATDGELAQVRALVSENHAALAGSRQIARFLCGMTSPASTRARLTGHDAFGMLAELPFAEVRVIAEAVV